MPRMWLGEYVSLSVDRGMGQAVGEHGRGKKNEGENMRKLAFGLALVFAIGLVAVPAMAEEGEFTSDGDMRLRWDYFQNYSDASDDNLPSGDNDTYDLFPYRARLGVQGKFTDRAWGRVEVQAGGWFGDPLATTGYPYPNAQPVNFGLVQLYQGYVTVEGGTFDFTAGRKETVLGNELQIGNNDFYNGLVFDGIDVQGDFSSWDLNLYYKHLNETFQARNDTTLWGADAVINIGSTHIDPYIIFVKNFNDAAGPGTAFPPLAEMYTFGIAWEKEISEEKKGWDLNVEIAGQTGDFGPVGTKVDIASYIFEGWFGWSFGGAGRVHLGYLIASGDDGTDLSETSAWVPLFTDPHANNRLGNLDLFAGFGPNVADPTGRGMSNIQDISLGYDWWGGERHHGMIAIHSFSRPETVGALSDDIGQELDLSYDYMYARNSRLEIGVSTLFAGDAISELTGGNDDNITRIWAQVHLNWGK